jgi:hypothetical protein
MNPKTAEEIGKRVHVIIGDHFAGTIVGGAVETGRWIVRADDGTERECLGGHLQELAPGQTQCCDEPDNAFTRYGISEEEFAAALEEAMRNGGADEEEIREQRLAVAVDAAMPDDGNWSLTRQEMPRR